MIVRLTLAGVPSTEYPVIMRPFRESGAHSSNNSRLGPTCMNPGLASTTQGGPSAIFFSQPRVCGTLDTCLVMNEKEAYELGQSKHALENKRVVSFGES